MSATVPDCPACAAKTLHTAEDWLNHPYAGHGYTREWGWTHKDLVVVKESK